MKTKRFESMAFLREYFQIPQSIKTQWAIIEENIAKEKHLRVALMLVGTDKYLDIARRSFYSTGKVGDVNRIIHPAIRQNNASKWRFCTIDESYLFYETPKQFIESVFYQAMYSKKMLKDKLY